ncbi:MAG: M23 family metallopeptidase, partial [Clostridia bacterium]|nr:M23 family metallopeptidase [Clostridia bacterium]
KKFDEITRTSEVLEPEDKLPLDSKNESNVTDDEIDENTGSTIKDDESNIEEYDPEIDGEVTGHILNYDEIETTTVAANINTLQWPVVGRISSEYGYRNHPITGKYSLHNGLDIAADSGTEILSAYDGVVKSAGYSSTYGYYMIITHSDNLETLYAHCSKLKADEGDVVKKGDTVALVGSTGRSTGPHLHFEVRVNSCRIDPQWLLSELREV